MAKKGLNLIKHTQITQENGLFIAHFELFGLKAQGTDERNAIENLSKALLEKIQSDKDAEKEMQAFVEEHGEVRDPAADLPPGNKEAMKAVRGVTRPEFEELLASSAPILVDFWAEWCKPCFMIAPAVRDLKNELEGTAEVVKVNIDEQRELADFYDVKSIPTLVLFRDGKELLRLVGARPKEELSKEINAVL